MVHKYLFSRIFNVDLDRFVRNPLCVARPSASLGFEGLAVFHCVAFYEAVFQSPCFCARENYDCVLVEPGRVSFPLLCHTVEKSRSKRQKLQQQKRFFHRILDKTLCQIKKTFNV